MNTTNNRFKKIVYDYDLVSGKVNKVSYQHGRVDAFYHTYLYDAENRITNVQSSTDSVNWDNDAFYYYYAHGPLARTILGQQQVQGINYAYTLQGWLKSINPAPYTGGSFTLRPDSADNVVANSAYSLLLNYFDGEYTPINPGGSPGAGVSTALGGAYRPLYNGNISSMGVDIKRLNAPLLYNYQYDQLNRLVHMDAWHRAAAPWNVLSLTTNYQENVTYDPNGNILTYNRNADSVSGTNEMDKLTYSYPTNSNQLDHISDDVTAVAHNDISGQASGNYQYDAIGQLISDAASHITNIAWTVYGKIDSISKEGDTVIKYTYDAGGNRISKTLVHAGAKETTLYARDAQGNVMSVYTNGDPLVNGGNLAQTELDIYGSSRLGIWHRTVDVNSLSNTAVNPYPLSGHSVIFTRGNKLFELSNHLGNVLVTLSDKRYGVPVNDSTVGYYNPQVVAANDYYPFGMLQNNRSFKEGSAGNYRYGFNGKEQDPEVGGVGNQYDYGFRIYDPRIGRFLSVDPLFKGFAYYTPYQFAGNMPIWAIDLDGLEEMKANSVAHVIKDMKGNIITKSTVVRDPERSIDNVSGVRRLSGSEIEVTPGLVDQNSPTFNTFTWQQVSGTDFIIKQSNTPIGQDAGGTVKPPQTNLVQTSEEDEEPTVPNNPRPVLKPDPPKINGHPVGKTPIHLAIDASFDANTDNINNKASVMKQVKQVVVAMKSDSKINITLSGNVFDPSTGPLISDPNNPTTLNGKPATTQVLQTFRAKAVADLLIKQGVNPRQIKYGSGSVSKDPKKGLSTDAVIKR